MRLPTGPTIAERCPRCERTFGCAAKTWGCWCCDVTLGGDLREQLAAQYEGCLCAECLRELAPQR
ncbi:MAG: cysteine-rich CWC family protein [Actinomycetota bacterium]|nr:cysteine-rich CWC family protein [Actinomycetota bacterium]